MTATDPRRGPAGEEPGGPASAPEPQPTLLEQMGGPVGLGYSAVPVVVFVAVNAFLSLTATIIVSVALGLAITGYRLLRGERFSLAVGGLPDSVSVLLAEQPARIVGAVVGRDSTAGSSRCCAHQSPAHQGRR